MADIQINKNRCKGCGLCVIFCPVGNLKMSDGLNDSGNVCAEVVDISKCTGCGVCYRMCADLAIRIKLQKDNERHIKKGSPERQ